MYINKYKIDAVYIKTTRGYAKNNRGEDVVNITTKNINNLKKMC